MTRLPVAVTCGEPAGIGPELAVKAWQSLKDSVPFFLIGDPAHLPQGADHVPITHPSEAPGVITRGLPILARSFEGVLTPGTPNPLHAQGVIDAISEGVELVQNGTASAICTAPIHKKALQDGAGFAHPGHTEFLSALAGNVPVVMMLASEMLRVVPVTIHIELDSVSAALTPDLLRSTLQITHAALVRDFGVVDPRLAVAGLNPHAGEGGKMGREEIEMISPVLEQLQRDGMRINGPLSADTMFHTNARNTYDAAICMYHDQALIPIKTLDFDRGVNVTLGLPFVRTSPDHGTALDIAGQDEANPSSMIEALKLAAQMVDARQKSRR